MKIKELYLWQMINVKKTLSIFYGIIYLAYIFSVIATKMNGEKSFGGMGLTSGIFIFVVGFAFFVETFKFGLCNGVSRKTILVTEGCTLVSLSLVMTLIDTFNSWLFSLIAEAPNQSIFTKIYGDKGAISEILWLFGIYLLFGIIGYFIATLNARLSKFMKFVVYLPIPILLLVGLPLTIGSLSSDKLNALGDFINKIVNCLKASSYNMLLVALIVSVVFYLFSILLVRKAPLKTA